MTASGDIANFFFPNTIYILEHAWPHPNKLHHETVASVNVLLHAKNQYNIFNLPKDTGILLFQGLRASPNMPWPYTTNITWSNCNFYEYLYPKINWQFFILWHFGQTQACLTTPNKMIPNCNFHKCLKTSINSIQWLESFRRYCQLVIPENFGQTRACLTISNKN